MELHHLAERVGRVEALDQLAEPLATKVRELIPPKTAAKDVLSGTWLGHPLHPLLTDIPIGMFSAATVLDLVGGRHSRRAADRLVFLGLMSSGVTAAAGAADWSDTVGEERRVGVAHAVANVAGVALYGASALARRRNRRVSATTLGLAGMASMSVGGYLGGHLSFSRGIGVNHTAFEERPSEWTAVLDEAALAEDGTSRLVEADGTAVLLVRRRGEVRAVANRCTHAGGPLDEGSIDEPACTVTCPWHQSEFRLDTGAVVHGPATVPQPTFEARVTGGKIEVRATS